MPGRTLSAARHFMIAEKPVFPIPFSGGTSDEVFQEILKGWHDRPIPGLIRKQGLRLALSWISGASSLIKCIRATLADLPEIFISRRRSDSGSAVGRMRRDPADYFGNKRVFVDETRIQPSATWQKSIDAALTH